MYFVLSVTVVFFLFLFCVLSICGVLFRCFWLSVQCHQLRGKTSRLASEMTCYVSSGTLNPTHSLTHPCGKYLTDFTCPLWLCRPTQPSVPLGSDISCDCEIQCTVQFMCISWQWLLLPQNSRAHFPKRPNCIYGSVEIPGARFTKNLRKIPKFLPKSIPNLS